MLALQTLLWGVPFASHKIAGRKLPAYRWTITGVAFGSIVSPASLGLYALGFYLPYVCVVPAIVGLLSFMLHGTPGYQLAIMLGLQDPRLVVDDSGLAAIDALNAVIWGAIYGSAGYALDRWRRPLRPRGL